MKKGISPNKYNEMLREIIAGMKMIRIVIANRISSSVAELYWNIGKRLYEFYTDDSQILPQVVAVLPWGHNNRKAILCFKKIFYFCTYI